MTQPTKRQIAEFNLPNNTASLIAMGINRYGIGFLFAVFMVLVYMDFRKSTEQFTELLKANVLAINTLSGQIGQSHSKVEEMKTTIHDQSAQLQRIESAVSARN